MGKYVYVEARIKSDEKEEAYTNENASNPYIREELGLYQRHLFN